MKLRKGQWIYKVLTAMVAIAIVCVLFVGETAYASMGSKKKHEGCYLNKVTVESCNKTYDIRSGLKPVGISNDISWNDFWTNMKISDCELVVTDACYGSHNMLVIYIMINDEWKELAYYNINTDTMTYEMVEEEFTAEYYDIKFGFSNNAGDYISTALYARVSREYTIAYNLDGGKFESFSVDSYSSGAYYRLINPVKEGYEFVGWTGTGLTEVTKTVTISNDDTGNKVYTAVWKSLTGDDNNNVSEQPTTVAPTTATPTTVAPTTKKVEETLGSTNISSATKKKAAKQAKVSLKKVSDAQGYQIQFSETKKFKKVLLTKNVKKVNVKVTSKKLENKKKIFVRARAYKMNGKEKVFSKNWSKVKRVTIK